MGYPASTYVLIDEGDSNNVVYVASALKPTIEYRDFLRKKNDIGKSIIEQWRSTYYLGYYDNEDVFHPHENEEDIPEIT